MTDPIEIITIGTAGSGLVVGWCLPRLADPIAAPAHATARRLEPAASALITAAAAGILVYRFHADPVLPTMLITTLLGITAALIDLRCQRLPDLLVVPGAAVCAVTLTAIAISHHDLHRLARAAAGAAAVGAVLLLLAAVTGGLGLGDVKTAAWLGMLEAWQSITTLSLAIGGALVLQAAAATILLVARKTNRHANLAFGPALITAAILALVV
jgi:leader peptidase (prepilin peptidase)/N-methyltransferase